MTINLSAEQQIAAYQPGGVLVSAGAGSGKTAVLVEHVIYKIDKIINENPNNELKILDELCKITVITFTVKASLEMKERLSRRVRDCAQEKQIHAWKIIQKNFHKIYVGTIDGLCASILLKNSMYLPFSSSVEIVDDYEWSNKMNNIFEHWLASIENENDVIFVKKWKRKIFNWLLIVFSSTSKRQYWKNIFESKVSLDDYLEYNKKSFDEYVNISEFIDTREEILKVIKFLPMQGYKDKEWAKYVEQIIKVRELSSSPFDFALKFSEKTSEFKGFKTPTAKVDPVLSTLIKKFRDWFSSYGDEILEWKSLQSREHLESWAQSFRMCMSLFQYSEENYGNYDGFCFSDLSYYALIVLREGPKQLFNDCYVVVDELQDTSEIQLEIIQRISSFKKENLYGVGDIKQAIYGFRGGKSHIFYEFSKLVDRNEVILRDNYRSLASIVNFNNRVFEKLLKSSGSVEQNSMIDSLQDDIPPVETISWNISEENELEEWQSEILEFRAIIEKIKLIKEKHSNDSIAILFRTNDQIRKFSSLLYNEGIPCSVQWKSLIEDDPLYIVFKMLAYIGSSREKNLPNEDLIKTLNFFISELGANDNVDLSLFFENVKIFDGFTAYVFLLNQLNVSIDLGSSFIRMLKKKSHFGNVSFEDYIRWLNEIKNESYMQFWNLPFESQNSGKIILQTIHASKGLQYDHVLLPRISRDRVKNRQLTTIIGEENPFIFRELTCLKSASKTPSWYYEGEKIKELEKNEGLRLFYVACTRAKKTLTMSLAQNTREDSWAALLLTASDFVNSKKILFLDSKAEKVMSQSHRLMPIFESAIQKQWHRQFIRNVKIKQELKITPSISVSALSVYDRCPRKFYYKSILEIDESSEIFILPKTQNVSSAKRGIEIHALLHGFFSQNLNYDKIKNLLSEEAAVFFESESKLINTTLSKCSLKEFESEIRFSWRDNILVGTPDMYCIDKSSLYIWDFKTGHLDDEDKLTYLLQIYWYVFAICQKYSGIKLAIISILALDDCKSHTHELSIVDVERHLDVWWQGFGEYATKKLSHCSKCSYQVYCHNSTT